MGSESEVACHHCSANSPLPARDPHLLHSPPNPEEGPPTACNGGNRGISHPTSTRAEPLSAVPHGCLPPSLPCREVLLTVCFPPPAAVWSTAFHPGEGAGSPFRPGDSVARTLSDPPLLHLAGSDPSIPTSRLAARVLRTPCQSHGSNFPTDYPRCRRPREKQLLYPDVGTLTEGRNQERSLTDLALEGFPDKAVLFGVGRGRGRWTGTQSPGE